MYYYNRRDYLRRSGYLERGVAYAAARELTHWEGYLRGWRAMIHVDQGDWTAAEGEDRNHIEPCVRVGCVPLSSAVALARLRLRWGEPDAATPLEEVRRLATSQAELQGECISASACRKSVASDTEERGHRRPAKPLRRCEMFTVAVTRGAYWAAEDAALWLHTLGKPARAAALALLVSGALRRAVAGRLPLAGPRSAARTRKLWHLAKEMMRLGGGRSRSSTGGQPPRRPLVCGDSCAQRVRAPYRAAPLLTRVRTLRDSRGGRTGPEFGR